jgi:hypothetical protein
MKNIDGEKYHQFLDMLCIESVSLALPLVMSDQSYTVPH